MSDLIDMTRQEASSGQMMNFALKRKGEPLSKSMYAKGRRIETISDFNHCGSKWYKWNGKTVHRSVLMSLQYRTLLNSIISGRVYVAERIADE